MQATEYPALLLNADFRPMSLFPLSLVSWQEAVGGVVRDRVAVVAEYDRVVRSPSRVVRLPSVVALRRYRRHRQQVAFTRYHVFLRDGFTCQYCLAVLPPARLTFDHVLPPFTDTCSSMPSYCRSHSQKILNEIQGWSSAVMSKHGLSNQDNCPKV